DPEDSKSARPGRRLRQLPPFVIDTWRLRTSRPCSQVPPSTWPELPRRSEPRTFKECSRNSLSKRAHDHLCWSPSARRSSYCKEPRLGQLLAACSRWP